MPGECSPGPVYTAAASGAVTQTPLPITLSGTVFEDLNIDNMQDSGELGIAGVTLTLYELDNGSYVATGKTATTDANGNYKFDGPLPGTYRVVETQPDGYLSVGDTPGTVNGADPRRRDHRRYPQQHQPRRRRRQHPQRFRRSEAGQRQRLRLRRRQQQRRVRRGRNAASAACTLTLLDANGNSTGQDGRRPTPPASITSPT